ncbi:unnamed protein product, partial [Effrenium voratum]
CGVADLGPKPSPVEEQITPWERRLWNLPRRRRRDWEVDGGALEALCTSIHSDLLQHFSERLGVWGLLVPRVQVAPGGLLLQGNAITEVDPHIRLRPSLAAGQSAVWSRLQQSEASLRQMLQGCRLSFYGGMEQRLAPNAIATSADPPGPDAAWLPHGMDAGGFIGHSNSRTSSREWRRRKGWQSPSWWDLTLAQGLVAQSAAPGVLGLCGERLSELSAVNCCTALHRVARLGDRSEADRPELRRLIHRIHHLVRAGTEPVSLASICWACGKMSYLNLPLFDDMATRMLSEGVGSMDCQECANVFWAHAMLELFHDPLFTALRARTASLALVEHLDVQGLANTAWAFAKLVLLDEPLMGLLAERFGTQLAEATAQHRSNFCWAHAALSVRPPQLAEVLAQCAGENGVAQEFELQDLTNSAWAFAILEAIQQPMLDEFAAEFLIKADDFLEGHSDTGALQEAAFAIVSLVWVYAFTSTLTPGLSQALSSRLSKVAWEVDRSMAGRRLSLPRAEGHQSNSPQVVVRTRGMAVLMKPPGWEVDGPHSEGSQSFLSDFLRKEFPTDLLPQLCDFQYGFIHRLDVPSSGLVLVGRSFEGLYSLRFQINSLSMQREYFVLCHGPAPASLRECSLAIHAARKGPDTAGKPALTWFSFVGHGRLQTPFSMAAIRIRTGRNHQIRSHALRCGFPTVADGRYTCAGLCLRASPAELRRALETAPRETRRVEAAEGGGGVAERHSSNSAPRSTSGLELRAVPGEAEAPASARRRCHVWSWQTAGPNQILATIR